MRRRAVTFMWLGLLLSQTAPAFPWQGIYSYTWHQADQAFRTRDYVRSASLYHLLDTADAAYNQGNALAYAGEYSHAIAAYDLALQKNPKHDDAKFNRKIIMSLLPKPTRPDKNKQQPRQKKSDLMNPKQQEQKTANKQWLNLVPDKSGSFLQEKFLRDYLKRR